MAKGVGLDIGEYEIKVVELDGSYKKPRLAKVSIDGVEPVAGDEEATRASETLHILKDAGIARENVCLAFPCREAVLRTLNMPFVGDDNIRKVVKFEVEGNIHSHNVDDMVVDFLPLEASATQTKVLVVAAPKAPLRARLKALEGVGIEPEAVDLDATALYRTADWLGCFAKPEADTSAGGEPPPPSAHLVIDVGARSTAMLVVIDGKLVDMRTVRTGTDAIVDDVMAHFAVPAGIAREAVIVALQTGRDQTLTLPAPPAAAEADPAAEPAAVARAELLPHATVTAARDRFLDRLRRELTRFLAAVPAIQKVDAVWYTGGGSQLPGVVDLLREVFETEPQLLDVLGRMQHGLDDKEAADVNPRIAIAVGLALGMMGGPARLDFRREDLQFSRRFDRIKFPLAVACMLGVFMLFFVGLKSYTQYRSLLFQYGWVTLAPSAGKSAKLPDKATFEGYEVSFLRKLMIGPSQLMGGKNVKELLLLDPRSYETLCADLARSPQFTQLARVHDALQKHKRTEEEKTGYYADLSMDSGFAVLVRMAEVLHPLESQLERYLLTDLRLELPTQVDGRYLEMTFALRGDFRAKGAAIKQAFRDDASKKESPFQRVADAVPNETKVFVELEPGEEGAYVTIKVMVKPTFLVAQK